MAPSTRATTRSVRVAEQPQKSGNDPLQQEESGGNAGQVSTSGGPGLNTQVSAESGLPTFPQEGPREQTHREESDDPRQVPAARDERSQTNREDSLRDNRQVPAASVDSASEGDRPSDSRFATGIDWSEEPVDDGFQPATHVFRARDRVNRSRNPFVDASDSLVSPFQKELEAHEELGGRSTPITQAIGQLTEEQNDGDCKD